MKDKSNRENNLLNKEIEKAIRKYKNSPFGDKIKRMYESGSNYETICNEIGIDYKEWEVHF